MNRHLDYRFEEMPTITRFGVASALVSGIASISYYDDGLWFVQDITLDGWSERPDGRGYEDAPLPLDEADPHFLIIHDELTRDGPFSRAIDDAVRQALEDDGVIIRSDYQEHNTHHHAAQGV